MFELITISNGRAVVQHASTGHVYRFRPINPGVWRTLMLERIDASDASEAALSEHAGAALSFAEEAVSSICQVATEGQFPMMPAPLSRRTPFGWRRLRRRPALS